MKKKLACKEQLVIRNLSRGPPPGYHGGDYGGAVPPMPHGDRGKKGVSWTPKLKLHCAITIIFNLKR